METLKLNTSTGEYLIDTSAIVRVQASSNYSKLYFSDGRMLVAAKLLSWFEEKLAPESFTRLHRSHLINNRYLHLPQRTGKSVELQNGKIIPVSRRRKKNVLQKLAVACLLCFLCGTAFSQNVGIGTANPTGRLHIDLNGTANTFAILIDDDDDPVIRIRKAGISKSFLEQSGDDFRIGTYSTNPLGNLVFRTNSVNRMYLTPAGNIGIGIADPVGRFQIGTGSDASATTHGYLMMGPENGENLILDNNEILARNNGVVSTLFLARDGSKVQLGNGSEASGTKLHITSGNDVGLPDNLSGYLMMGSQAGSNMVLDNNEIQVRNNGAAAHMYLQNGGGNVFIGDATNFTSGHRLGVDGNAVVTGALRVGTTVTPSGYKLAVDGKAICTELLVRLVPNWPDYVFHKNYKLPGLLEVESFIEKNNHLPGIPSAKTIEANGINVGEMLRLQMQKIEELTLYIIELKKEIEKLSQRDPLGKALK